jgi:excisionase family DNA binding protein
MTDQPIPAEDQVLYTFPQAAHKLQIKENTLRLWVTAGTVQHTRLGRHVRFSDDDIDAIIRENRRPVLTGKRLPGAR